MKSVPIKFRGRDIETGELICGRDIMQYSENDIWIGDVNLSKNYCVDAESIAQLVGYDADGNELYDGDMKHSAESGLDYKLELNVSCLPYKDGKPFGIFPTHDEEEFK